MPPAKGESRARGWFPQMAPATARITKPRPMVSMSTANGGSPIMERSTPRSKAIPKPAMMSNVAANTRANGRPARLARLNATNAPSIMMSPCAKLTISVAL